jgi:hypothetical protein
MVTHLKGNGLYLAQQANQKMVQEASLTWIGSWVALLAKETAVGERCIPIPGWPVTTTLPLSGFSLNNRIAS